MSIRPRNPRLSLDRTDLWNLGSHRSKIMKQQSVRCLARLMGRCRLTTPYPTGDLDVAN
jgi:hypothetical protein